MYGFGKVHQDIQPDIFMGSKPHEKLSNAFFFIKLVLGAVSYIVVRINKCGINYLELFDLRSSHSSFNWSYGGFSFLLMLVKGYLTIAIWNRSMNWLLLFGLTIYWIIWFVHCWHLVCGGIITDFKLCWHIVAPYLYSWWTVIIHGLCWENGIL